MSCRTKEMYFTMYNYVVHTIKVNCMDGTRTCTYSSHSYKYIYTCIHRIRSTDQPQVIDYSRYDRISDTRLSSLGAFVKYRLGMIHINGDDADISEVCVLLDTEVSAHT